MAQKRKAGRPKRTADRARLRAENERADRLGYVMTRNGWTTHSLAVMLADKGLWHGHQRTIRRVLQHETAPPQELLWAVATVAGVALEFLWDGTSADGVLENDEVYWALHDARYAVTKNEWDAAPDLEVLAHARAFVASGYAAIEHLTGSSRRRRHIWTRAKKSDPLEGRMKSALFQSFLDYWFEVRPLNPNATGPV